MSTSGSRSGVVLELAEEFLERYRRGQRPSLKEYIDRHPALADEIREVFPAMAMMENIALADESLAGAPTGPAPRPMAVAIPLEHLGDYRILREIGRGGMGVVYEAKQLSLGRQVALKILPQHVARDAMMLERFRREARAAARLHHTNIVPVFEVGRDGDLCYYAMQFIRGQGLDLVYEELRRLRGRAKTGRGGDADGVAQSTTHAAPAASVSGIEYQVVDRPPFTNAPTAGDPAISKVTHALLTGRFASEEPQFARPPAADTLLGPSNDGCATEGEVPAGATEPPMTGQSRASSSAAPPASPDSAVLPGGTSISGAGLHVSHYHHSIAQIGSQLAQGLAYAHARGVIHRDIKPSNLLLDTAGVAWITDFGLAKADDEGLTQSGDLLGTLRYMAPERFRGEGDARADVYALGLTLYELITLEPAFEAGDRLQLIEQVKSAEPVKPRLIDKRIPRDLETIVLKAIDKDPKRRYPTADAMAEDLRRFLDDEPILARRTSAVERYGRWARRNPWVAVLGGLLTAVLLAATGVSLVVAGRMAALAVKERQAARAADQATIQAESRRIEADEQRRAADASRAESLAQSRAARANFERARTAVDDFFTKVSESKLLSVPGLQSLRAELLGSALGFYGELVQERADDPSLRRDLLLSRFRAGRVLHELGRDAEARAILRTAIAGYEQELREHPVDPDLKAGFAAVTFLSSSIDPVAEQKTTGFERAIALREEVLKARSNDASNKFELAETYNALANDRHHRGDRDALSAYERSLMLKLELAAASPDDPGIIRGLGAAFNNLANEFASDNTRGQALAMYEQASELNREAIRLRPSDTTMAHKLYVGTSNLCSTLSELHRVDELVAAWRSTIATLRSMAHANPDVPDVHAAHFQAVLALADALLGPNASGADEAVRTLLDARDALEQMPRATAEDLASSARQRVAFAQKLGAIKTKLSRDEALVRDDQLDRAVQTFRQAIAAGWRGVDEIRVAFALKARPGYASLLAEAEAADALPAKSPHQGAMAAGAPSARASGAASRSTLDLRRSRAIALGAIGRARFKEGQIEEGQAALGRSLAIFKAIRRERPDDPLTLADLVAAQVAIGQVLWEAGKLREGANEWRAARSTLAAFPRHAVQKSAATDAALESWQTMARTYAQHGLCQEAAELFEEAVPLARDTLRQRVALDLYDFNAACMRLHSGDVDAYRRMCAELVEHYGNLDDSWVRMLLAWVTAIHPQSGVDPARRTNWAAAAESALRGHYLWQLAKQVHGMALYRAGRWAEAIAKIRESEQIYPEWPSQPSNWCLRAMAAFQMGQTREAQFLLRRVEAAVARLRAPLRDPADLTILPSNPSLDRQRWRHAIVWHEWLPLELLYAEASRLINGTPPAHLAEDRIVRGVVYARLGDAARAEADLRAAVEQAPDAPSVWLTRSHAFRLLGRTGEAESDLERAFRLPGGVCETWTDEYRWLVERGESATARRVLDRIVSVEPTTAISWSQRALVLVAAGRIGAARRDLVQAAKMTADSSDIAAVDRVVIECIQLPVLERRWVDALALVRAVNPLSRTGPMGAVEVFLERIEANLLILTGDRAGFDRYARATLKRAQAEPGPTFPGELAWICALSPNAAVDTAIMLRLAEEAVSKRPIDDVWWRLALSCCLVRAGRYESALNTLDDVVRIDPGWDLATNDIVRALAHHHLGHDAEARHWLAIATRKMVTSSATGLDWPLWVRTNLHDALAHEALYHEAVTLILDPAFPVDPFRCAPRD